MALSERSARGPEPGREAARAATSEERDLFGLTETEPVLALTRLIRDADDHPIEADAMTMPARSTRLRCTLKATR
ncbi:UTRA domain-containing protein [Actinocorallia herbida]|uniref:UTRA domain-containing protein n=1 Tax=Actinocorallia herbida TaxID=58109 RepID=UPI000F4CF5E6|nr:UTRA domain-containing protein [Actinocorallia herbida]